MGFLALFHILHHQMGAVKDYDVAMAAAKANLEKRIATSLSTVPEDTLICGDSICVRDLWEQTGMALRTRLAQRNIWMMPTPPHFADVHGEKTERGYGVITNIRHMLFLSKFCAEKAEPVLTEAQRWKRILKSSELEKFCFVPYELLAGDVIARRHPDLAAFQMLPESERDSLLRALGLEKSILQDRFVHIGTMLPPYPDFYSYLLSKFSTGCKVKR